MRTSKYGQVFLNEEQLMELLYQDKQISHVLVEDSEDLRKYEEHQSELLSFNSVFVREVDETLTVEEFHENCMDEWFMPESYKHINLLNWLTSKCSSEEEVSRIKEEYSMFDERGLLMLLRFFIYFVDKLRTEKVIWGVGRGSSVNSFILYKIGIHRVNSLAYGLDIKEYLK